MNDSGGGAPPDTQDGRGLQRPVPSLAISSGLAAVFLIVNLGLHRATPSFREMYDDLGAPLPALTNLVMSAPAFAWVIVGVLGATLVIAKDFVLSVRWRDSVNRVAFLMLAVYCVGLVICLFRPLVGRVIRLID